MSEGERKLELLLDLGAMVAREVGLDELLGQMGARVAGALAAERATVWLLDAATGELRARVADHLEPAKLALPPGRGVAGAVAQSGQVVRIDDVSRDARFAGEVDERTGFRTRSMLCAPIALRAGTPPRVRGVIQVLNKQGGAFLATDEAFLVTVADQLARVLEYTTLRAADTPRGVPIRGPFNHIVGDSPAMRPVYERLARAAATSATVLVTGETGTGKGLVARAIHVNSARREGPLVVVDCTTLPAQLVESELFGHERGAYTGADARVIGKVELASGGTLVLDELGELPLELQPKLLRFLQDKSFERVGGRQTLTADVRLMACTHRDLGALVAAGKFRADLYYRVRVLELELPPLRTRGEADRLALAEHFAHAAARRHDVPTPPISAAGRAAILAHAFPGNVRELEHAIERAVVLGGGAELSPELLGLAATAAAAAPTAAAAGTAPPSGLTLDAAMRAYAAATLAACDGNRSEAARRLGISRNRLARLLGA